MKKAIDDASLRRRKKIQKQLFKIVILKDHNKLYKQSCISTIGNFKSKKQYETQ